ncbi:MAG TPA: hypothetical protein VN731_07290 [Rhodanobacter sp.]|nr:hypothetical protein [Rhodanobacter sp.]
MINAKTAGLAELVPCEQVMNGPRSRSRQRFVSDPHFHAAVLEMEAIGLRVQLRPHSGSAPFGVLSGRTGSRFFLLPAHPRAVSAGSLALVQPVRFAPRMVKGLAMVGARFGLTRFLLPRKVHISGAGDFARMLGCGARHCAFLTGTPGPHRKLSAQLMDDAGQIRAYAKVSLNPAVHALLEREAEMLQFLGAIDLKSARVPRVLLNEVRSGTAILVTDTVRATGASCLTDLDALHLTFLAELAARTASGGARSGASLLADWVAQVERLGDRLAQPWRQRFDRAMKILSTGPQLFSSRGLAHGDFTPVNSFRQRGRLYVFDWEYAGDAYPADYDLICYLDAVARLGGIRPASLATTLGHRLVHELGRSPAEANRRLIAFYCVHALRDAGRQPHGAGMMSNWAGENETALALDALLSRAFES